MKYPCILLATVIALAPAIAPAQSYPTKPVRFIAPFPPGGSTDLLARLVAQKLSEAWGQQVVVENRGGAGGTVATRAIAKSPPDGHTILLAYTKLPYDAIRDFTPITLLAMVPNGMVVHPSFPARTVKEFLAIARAKPKQVLYGSGGNGSATHLAVVYLELTAKIELVHIPYKGAGPSIVELIAGHTAMTITGMPALMPHIKSGRLRPIGVGTAQRLAVLPDVPTIAESGVPGFEANQWYGILVPAATPRDLVARLNADIVKVLQRPDVKERLAADGAEAVGNTSEEFGAHIKREIARWAPVVRASGAKPES
jgi:tripartite-type tricarboxylate transporter receptor subunit TctC